MKNRLVKNKAPYIIRYIVKFGFLSLLAGFMNLSVYAQQGIRVSGSVSDNSGELLMGVSVTIRGTVQGTMTNDKGEFSLTVASDTVVLVFSSVGYELQNVKVGARRIISVILKEEAVALDDVTIVAFGTQRKESVTSAIQTVNVRDLVVPSSNLTTAFAGRIAGMISYQTSGEPGRDNAEFFIRGITTFGTGKVDPLILIDNVEVSSSDLAKMHPDDIESFSILKDAAATALYGARGANGVILVTTKEGKEGKVLVSVRLENSFSSPTKRLNMADPITYMELANEAASTRDPLAVTPYSKSKIDNTRRGGNSYVYPAVDWMDMLVKNVAVNQRANISVSGGGAIARYYVAGSFAQDNGILKVDNRNNFNNNIDYKKYLLRSNININLTKSTEMTVRLSGTFDDNKGPLTGGNDMYKQILKVSPVRFPPYYAPDENFKDAGHILFGGDGGSTQSTQYLNPYAEMLKGYKQESNSTMMAQLELKQDLGKWIKGLTARALANTTRNSVFDLSMRYQPFYYKVLSYDRQADNYNLYELNPLEGTEYLNYYPGGKKVNTSVYGEASIAYDRTFNEAHNISGMLVGVIRNYQTANATELSEALPHRNLGLSGRFTYSYGSRYFTEFNFGYNGSEKFDKGHRWGFFPSVGLGWLVSNEKFWTDDLKKVVSLFKIRGTYGLVGNDEIGDTRFFYLSNVYPGGGGSFMTGYDLTASSGAQFSGYSIKNYPNSKIGWEIAYKSNLGIELGLFKGKVEILVDLFKEDRTNILQSRADIPISMGLWAIPTVNVGEAVGKGVDVSVDYKHSFNKDVWLLGRMNFTYAHSTYSYYEEPNYAEIGAEWKSKIGRGIKQGEGYIAERLFIDWYDVNNSPRQDISEYMPGDIKYKDINGDNVINDLDIAPIGYPTTPEINYGFGASAGYKNLDFSIFFSGSARSSFWIDAAAMSPFVRETSTASASAGLTMENGLAKFIADDYWSELSQNPYAAWPRLSDRKIANNNARSTWFMHDNPFLRIKSAEIGYSLPQKWINKVKLSSFRIYASGTNLWLFSKFDLWDVEMGGSGLNYPLQRVFNLGINLSF
ncbi:MAG: TonB-dependent receptor [Prevotellaceae bacterium]|jgi:TonB-linked SusC/RagA family outer membrane protein|nr:TonB-dependent receptor [Prevotellaceae bacterium]